MGQNGEHRDRPHMYSQPIFNKGANTIQWRMEKGESNKWCWINQASTCRKENNLGTNLTSFTKVNSKWIIYLWVKCKPIKLL